MTEVIPHEAALTTTLKGEGRDAPWIVIRSRDSAQLQSQLRDLEHGSVFTDVGRVTMLMNTYMRMGAKLDASALESQKADGNWENPSGPAATAPPNGAAAPAPATPQQSAPSAIQPPTGSPAPGSSQPAQQQAPQQFPGASGGGMAPQMGAPGAPPVQGAPDMGQPQQQMWGNAVVPPVQQAPQAQWTPPGAPTTAPPAQQPPSMFSGPPAMPGAPVILGRPARFHQGTGAKGPYSAYFDPRSPEELASVPVDPATGRRVQTNDPNDPRLAAGQAEFTLWLK